MQRPSQLTNHDGTRSYQFTHPTRGATGSLSLQPDEQEVIGGALDHALPTGHLDRLLFGFPGKPHAGIIYGAFVSIAMSAQLRGWRQSEFEAMVTEIKCNRKGRNRNRWFWSYKLWQRSTPAVTTPVVCSTGVESGSRQSGRPGRAQCRRSAQRCGGYGLGLAGPTAGRDR